MFHSQDNWDNVTVLAHYNDNMQLNFRKPGLCVEILRYVGITVKYIHLSISVTFRQNIYQVCTYGQVSI